ncbi:MAG: dCTP deaminase domain-containing protein [Halobacteriota archaeon]
MSAMLIKEEIKAANIVRPSQTAGERHSTYDATVGMIFKHGGDKGATYELPPRGVVWVVSQEEFHMPKNATGLATVKTKLAHKGVFALNVGVVDPGWKGPIATALVNFSTEPFTVNRGDPFLRLVILDHKDTGAPDIVHTADRYAMIAAQSSRAFADSFLSIDSVAGEVTKKLLSGSNLIFVFTIVGLLLSGLSIFGPIAWTVWTNAGDAKTEIVKLQNRVEQLEAEGKKRDEADKQIVQDRERLKDLEALQKNVSSHLGSQGGGKLDR